MSDLSSNITVVNNSELALTLTGSDAQSGSFENLPNDIAVGATASFALRSPSDSAEGSKGSATYQLGEKDLSITLAFADPASGDNAASGAFSRETQGFTLTFTGAAGSPEHPEQGSVPPSGHPIWIVYTLNQLHPDATTDG